MAWKKRGHLVSYLFGRKIKPASNIVLIEKELRSSVAEPHHFYEAPAPAPIKNFNAAPDPAAPAPDPTLLYSKEIFLKQTKV
jgi:hypothetical protein